MKTSVLSLLIIWWTVCYLIPSPQGYRHGAHTPYTSSHHIIVRTSIIIQSHYILSLSLDSLIPYVKNSGCLEQRKHSLPHLNEEARSYVEQLAKLATL